MKIVLSGDTTEFSNGEFHWHKDKQPFEVDARVGQDLIKTGHFEEFRDEKPEKKKAEKEKK